MPDTQIKVLLTRGRESLGRYVLKPGAYLVGRDPASDIVVDCADVSQRHARLSVTPDEVRYEDLGSSNGSFVEGERINAAIVLRLPQQVRLGSVVLEIDWAMPSESGDGDVGKKKAVALSREEALRVGEHYRASTLVARGGMGSIHEAEDLHLGRTVAMKRLLSGSRASPDSRQRFLREAEILGRLEHPNIVPVHDLCIDEEGELFYTMKFVKGVTLHRVLDEIKTGNAGTIAKYPLTNLLTIFQKVCDAVSFAHSKGIVHRDLKPENVMLGDFGEVLVMDWGLAKLLGSRRREEADLEGEFPENRPPPYVGGYDESSASSDPLQTLEGRIMGTPNFMAPEQAEGRISEIDERTDIFALGGILYNILTLEPPVSGATLVEALEKIRRGNIRPPTDFNPGTSRAAASALSSVVEVRPLAHCPGRRIPAALSAVTMKALALKSEHRYQTVAELQKDIAAFQGGFATGAEQAGAWRLLTLAIKRRKTEFGISAMAAALILALGAGFVWKVTSTLAQLKKAVPSFYAETRALIQEKKFQPALEKISYAISLAPTEAEYHCVRGNIHESLLNIAEAREDYARALKREPRQAQALENFKLCEKLLSENHGKQELSLESLDELRMAMINQGRSAEAVAMAERLAVREKGLFDSVKLALTKAGVNGELTKDGNGLLVLSLKGSSIKDLSPLKGLRLASLTVSLTSIADLTPLRGMPLTRLDLWGCGAVTNIEAVRGMPLTDIVLNNTGVSDLSPLAGAKLTVLEIAGTAVSDLTLLKEMPLKILRMDGCTNVQDFRPLRSLPLEILRMPGTAISDLSFVTNMMLTELHAGQTKIVSLAPLRGMSLTTLSFEGTRVSDLSPLTGMPLTDLDLSGTLVSNLTALKGMPLKSLTLPHTKVTGISPLKGMALTYCELQGTLVSDVSPLAGMPLNWLGLGNTRVTDFSSLAGTTVEGHLGLDDAKISDLASLKGIKFSSLGLARTKISDLSPLKGMALKALFLEGCVNLRDLSPLAECQQLEVLTIPATVKNVEVLRQLPNLKQLGYSRPDNQWQRINTAADFWKEYDARKK